MSRYDPHELHEQIDMDDREFLNRMNYKPLWSMHEEGFWDEYMATNNEHLGT